LGARPCAAGPRKISSTRLSRGSAIGVFAIGEEPMSTVLPGNPGAVATVVGARRRVAARDIRPIEPESGVEPSTAKSVVRREHDPL
jgi:hypothetical protein